MKSKYTIVLSIFLVIFSFVMRNDLLAAEKIYVMFDDIDEVYNSQGNIVKLKDGTSARDYLYYKPLLVNNIYTPNLIKSGWANFWSAGKKLTDFEVAVFWMGNKPLQYSAGGHRVVTEIKKMLDAGKRVILIGNLLLYYAFNPGSSQRDAEVQAFFKDYMGIDQNAYNGLITQSGGNPIGFGCKAVQGDPVSKGYKKVCNAIAGPDLGQELYPPWRFTGYVDVINNNYVTVNKDSARAVKMEFVLDTYDWFEMDTAPETDIMMGVHIQGPSNDPVQDYKIVYWTSGFEIACATQSMPDWTMELWYAMNWCTKDIPKPGPNLQFNVDPLDFETVAVGDSSFKEVKITNKGRETLEVYDVYLEDFAPSGIFNIETDDIAFSLKPGKSKYIKVKFTPSEEVYYNDYLDVESNAGNGKTLGIEVVGWGGKKPKPGPRIAVAKDTLDFGTLSPTGIDTLYLEITNVGVDLLIIQQRFYWPNEKKPPFMYATGVTWPISLDPGDTSRTPIRFAPVGKTGTFIDKIGIVPYNAVNYVDDTLWVYLKGVSSSGSGNNQVSFTSTELNIDSTEIGKDGFAEFTMENTGKSIIYISKLQFEDDFDRTFILLDKNDEEFQEKLPWAMFLAGPQKKRKVKVQFHPKEAGVFNGKIDIEFMDGEDNPLPELKTQISVTAIAKDTSAIGVEDNVFNSQSSINLNIYPNPVNESAKLNYSFITNGTKHLEIFLVDILGNKVKELVNQDFSSGNYSQDIMTESIASGLYYIVAQSGSDFIKIPVIIMK